MRGGSFKKAKSENEFYSLLKVRQDQNFPLHIEPSGEDPWMSEDCGIWRGLEKCGGVKAAHGVV